MCSATKIIGREIKNARENKKITQKQLAKTVGISRNYLSDIECGRYTPSVEKLLLLSKSLDINLNTFRDISNLYEEEK